MKNILYLTSMPSPFQDDFLDACVKELGNNYAIKVYYTRESNPERAHWGESRYGEPIFHFKKNEYYKFLSNSNPSIIVFTQFTGKIFEWGRKWCDKNNIPYFIGPAEIMALSKRSFLKNILIKRYLKSVLKSARGIMVMGNSAVRYIQEIYSGPVANIPYSFDLSRLLSFPQLPLKNNPITFLYSGRLVEFRNPLKCIRMFGELVRMYPDKKLKFIISGTGPLMDACLQEIEKQNIKEKVEWIIDFKDWYDIQNLYKKAHILLSLQHYSTWGLITQEAMAAGMTTISSYTIFSADQLIVDNYNGFLVPTSEEIILKKMQYYVEHPESINLHGKRSREMVKTIDCTQSAKNFCDMILA